MIKSMTAYGRGVAKLSYGQFIIELFSVNRKNLDMATTLPKELLPLDIEIRKWVQNVAHRGSISIKIAKDVSYESTSLNLSIETLRDVKKEIEKVALELNLKPEISIQFLIEQSQKCRLKEPEVDENDIRHFQKGVEEALRAWDKMREVEGKNLAQDLIQRLSVIKKTLLTIEEQAPHVAKSYEEKLKKKLIESPFFIEGDFERICKEVLIYSDRIDISEEMTRLKSHIQQFLEVIESGAVPVGKKLDFLIQEMNREANSLGVKCQDLEIIQLSVLIKSEIEKIREQVQNVE